MKIVAIAIFGLLMSAAASHAQGLAPALASVVPTQRIDRTWSPVVVPTGDYRQQVKALPVEQRPGRLLHVYGNTIRYRQQAATGNTGRPIRRIIIGRSR